MYLDGGNSLILHPRITECAVFGYAVDVINGESDNLGKKMLNFGSSIDEIITYEKDSVENI